MGVIWRYLKENTEPLSSDIDWCEPNYVVTEYIAEFYNTISNIPFFIYAPLLCYLYRPYARQLCPWTNSVFYILIFIGMGSMYFHATLSLVGQLIDELAILWVVVACIVLWLPVHLQPKQLSHSIWMFRTVVISVSIVLSVLCGFYPIVNSFALMAVILPIMYYVSQELKRCDDPRVLNLGRHALIHWAVAILVWVCDRVFCPFWLYIGFPYLHAFWHILVAIGPSYIIGLCIYFHTMSTTPDLKPTVRYWPKDNEGQTVENRCISTLRNILCIPFITVDSKYSNINNNTMITNINKKQENLSRSNSYSGLTTKEALD